MNAIFVALVNAAILSALVTASVWLGMRAARRRALNAATRYLVWWATLAVAIALPLAFLPVHSIPSAGRATSPAAVSLERAAPSQPIVAPTPIAAPTASRPPWFPIEMYDGQWPGWILTGWAVVSLLMLTRLIVSCVALERRKARAVPAPERLAARCGSLRRNVRIACSTEISTPMAAGLRHPAILFPARLVDELEDADLNQICLHEAAHLARRDDYALIVQRVVEALFALHPVVRWIARQIDLEREIACDDLVVAATGRPRPYAACLTRVVELAGGVRVSPAGAAAADEASHLATRVEALLDKTSHKGTHILKARLAAVAVALAALSSLAARTPRLVAFAPPLSPLLAQLFTPPVPVLAQPQAPPAPPAIPRPAKPMVLISVNVVDPLNRFVTGLEMRTFKLFEDGVEQEIAQFSSEDAAISVGIVFDTSGSMGRALPASREAVARFLKVASPDDEFFLVQFGDRPELVQGFTANPEDIQDHLTYVQSRGRTALLDAVYMALFQIKKARNPRKAILIVSDGDDNGSRYLENEVAIIVRGAGVQIYAIGVAATPGSALLDRITTESAGRHFPVDSPNQLQDAAAKIAIELRNQYVLGYIPQNVLHDGKFRIVEVKLDQPRGLPPLRVIYPDGYYAVN